MSFHNRKIIGYGKISFSLIDEFSFNEHLMRKISLVTWLKLTNFHEKFVVPIHD